MTHTFYTAVGNRRQPADAIALCREVGRELAARGLSLRTGAGDDSARKNEHDTCASFLAGAEQAGRADSEVFRPGDPVPAWAHELASRTVSACTWLTRPENWRQSYAREVMQVLGRDGHSPSRFVLVHGFLGERVATRVAEQADIPWINLRGLTLADALVFAHQHAGVPVLRPGDLLPSRLIPEGSMIVRAGSVFIVYFDGGMRCVKNPRGEWRGWSDFPGTPAGRDADYPDDVPAELVALGLTQETATADNLRRLAQEHEERVRVWLAAEDSA